jgi:hypothetical protein
LFASGSGTDTANADGTGYDDKGGKVGEAMSQDSFVGDADEGMIRSESSMDSDANFGA